jgi:hypothetical protein
MSGGLKKAELKILEGKNKNKTIPFLYNPDSISYRKEARWVEKLRPATNVGNKDFAGGRGAHFSITKALFDTTLPKSGKGQANGGDVRDSTDKLIELMELDDTLKPPRPPKCQFIWGAFLSFEVNVVSVDISFEMFAPDGKPIRAFVDIKFEQSDKDENKGKLPRQNPTSGSYARKIWTVLEGETLDWIAYQEYGDANAWRHIAESNGLNDPMNLRPGQLLKLTPLE